MRCLLIMLILLLLSGCEDFFEKDIPGKSVLLS